MLKEMMLELARGLVFLIAGVASLVLITNLVEVHP